MNTKVEYELLITCPICHEPRIVPITDLNEIKNAKRFPVSIVDIHGKPEHAITLFIDEELRVRAIQPSDILANLESLKNKVTEIKERYIPIPLNKKVKIDDLSRDEIIILSLADGQRELSQICEVINISLKRGKLLAEKLVRLKRLAKVKKEYST
ncbi:MAG: hypothetical protein ACTSQE_11965 [Candidatus Heimdallarchaeaceae archaeon]